MSAEGFHFNVKQWLGDDAILLMDWDVRAMHLHLMCIAWQKSPPGKLPNDERFLKKWLGNPNDEDWANRIKPQLFQGWRLADDTLIQDGLAREWERQASNSEKRRAAAHARWKKDPEHQTQTTLLISSDGEPILSPESGIILSTLLKDSSSLREEATAEDRVSIWSVGIKLLKHEGFSEDKVRSYLGKLIQEHGEKVVAEAVASLSLKPISPADAKSYLIGILRSEGSKRKGRGRVAL